MKNTTSAGFIEGVGRPPEAVQARLVSWAPGLAWLSGVWARWTGPRAGAGWDHTFLLEGGSPVAAAVGERAPGGWWALAAGEPAQALRLVEAAPQLQRAALISTGADVAEALLAEGALAPDRVLEVRRFLAMQRRQGGVGAAPAGRRIKVNPPDDEEPMRCRLAEAGDVRSLMAFPLLMPGQRMDEARAVIAARASRGEVWVVEQAGRIGAMAEALPAGKYRDLQRVHTLEAFRRQGMARLLVSHIAQVGAEEGWGLSLCVGEENAAALALYASLGFETVWLRADLRLRQPRALGGRP